MLTDQGIIRIRKETPAGHADVPWSDSIAFARAVLAADQAMNGTWQHCSPALLASGVNCASAPRRPCACEIGGSHDHWVPSADRAKPQPLVSDAGCKWPTKPLSLVQVTVGDTSMMAVPERAYFDARTVNEAVMSAAQAKSEPAVPRLSELVAEAKALCDIDYCFGEADRQAKERRAWVLISKLSRAATPTTPGEQP